MKQTFMLSDAVADNKIELIQFLAEQKTGEQKNQNVDVEDEITWL